MVYAVRILPVKMAECLNFAIYSLSGNVVVLFLS